MPHVIAIANTKGGVGKSTLAVNLAVEAATSGREVLLVDADPQASAAQFVSLRDGGRDNLQAVRLTQATIHRQIKDLAAGYDLVFIDVGGRDAPVLRSAIGAAETILVPVVPSAFDAWASEDIFDVVDEVRAVRDDLSVQVLPNLVTSTVSAREALAELRQDIDRQSDVELLDVALHNRTAWPRAIGEGLSVVEWEPKGKAAAELRQLCHILEIT